MWQEDIGHHRENRYVVIGMDYLAQIVTVVFTFRGDIIRIISARPATNNERKMYEYKRN
ncbi:MAG: BrnT family toxin [Anaerolineales bacterium]|nr:BrnT family toxin [Anaerolineales bacterium]